MSGSNGNGSGPHSSDRWYARTPEAIRELLRQTRSGPPPAPEIAGVFYRGQTHGLVGKRDAGKSLFMALVARDILNGGGSVLWIDHEQGARRVLRRMDQFGTNEEALAERFYLVDQARDLPPRDAIEAFAGVDLVVLDALTGQLASSGLNDNHAVDIDLVYDAICKPLAHAHGACFVSIDHVPHGEGDRPLGSQRKSSAPDAELILKCVGRFKPGEGGRARLVVGRDRDGAIVGCEFILEPGADMEFRVTVSEVSTTDSGEFRPTALMKKCSQYLEAQAHPVSRRDVERNVEGKAQYLRAGLDILIAEGFVTTEQGSRGSILCRSVRAFRATDDSTASHRVPTESGRTRTAATGRAQRARPDRAPRSSRVVRLPARRPQRRPGELVNGRNGAASAREIDVSTRSPEHIEPLMDSQDVADLCHVPVTWVRQEARAGRLPSMRLGHYVRFDRGEVAAWLESLKEARR